MKNTWLITGGAGFIGSNIAEYLVSKDQKVRILDNLSTGNLENLKNIKNDIDFIQGDIRDYNAVDEALENVDYVLHHAAQVSVMDSIQNPSKCFDINNNGTLMVLKFCVEHKIKKFINVSSSAVYGEGFNGEDSTTNPLSPYALSKYINEGYCQLYYNMYGLNSISLRYFNVYGPKQNIRSDYSAVIPKFIHNIKNNLPITIYGTGKQSRDFIHVRDVAELNMKCALFRNSKPFSLNVCTGQQINILELVDLLGKISGKKIKVEHETERKGEIFTSGGFTFRLKNLLKYNTKVSLLDGLKELYDL